MIGGTDIVIPTRGGASALDACTRIIKRYWTKARFEDALTGEKYDDYAQLPIGRMRELFVYPDGRAEESWDAGSPDSPPNSMIYLILSAGFVTAVVDDPSLTPMRSILESLRQALGMDILNTEAERGFAEAA